MPYLTRNTCFKSSANVWTILQYFPLLAARDILSIYRAKPELSAKVYAGRRTADWGGRLHLLQYLLRTVGEGCTRILEQHQKFAITREWTRTVPVSDSGVRFKLAYTNKAMAGQGVISVR